MKKVIILGICMMLVITAITATAALNNPPSTPTIEGASSGTTGTEYEYRFCSSDPDGDDVYYCIDWGDGAGEICVGPFPSGTCITEKHTWTSDGTYQIKAKAQDSNQAESEYATLSVSMPKGKQVVATQNTDETTLEIAGIIGEFGGVTTLIENTGSADAENFFITISVKGGILNNVDILKECGGCGDCSTVIGIGEIKSESTLESGMFMGFGPLSIVVTARAANADLVTKETTGFILGPIVIIK